MTEFGTDAKYLPGTRIIDISGERYGRLTVTAFSHRKNGTTWFECRCDCGAITKVPSGGLRKGLRKSCGCLLRDILIERNTTHGKTNTKTYRIYRGMLNRCNNKDYAPYPDYGGRGITVCEKWSAFEGFLEDMGECPPNLTLERIDNDGPYSKDNCVWGTRKVQARNRRTSHMLTFNGKTQCMAAWAEEVGLKLDTLKRRIYTGWSTRRALATPTIEMPRWRITAKSRSIDP